MNISDMSPLHDLAGLLSGLHDVSKSKPQNTKVEPKPNNNEDQVRISTRAKEFQRAYELVVQAPDIRADKLAPVEEALKTGTYNVRGEQVANKLIAHTILDRIL
jgi:negative regulator of flagellin synthesis FlgM